jgi:tripartite-type tricarboxylate transporter receptor subunit TctC
VGTPQEIVRSLNRDINTALASEEIKTKLNGVEIVGGTPEYFRKFAAEEFAKWGKVARSLGLQVD